MVMKRWKGVERKLKTEKNGRKIEKNYGKTQDNRVIEKWGNKNERVKNHGKVERKGKGRGRLWLKKSMKEMRKRTKQRFKIKNKTK